MQTLFVVFLAFLNYSPAFAELKANCSDENTFLKLNEIRINEAGERVAELFMNFKDLNRILNLPEVILRTHKNGILVNEANGSLAVLLSLTEKPIDQTQIQTQENSVSNREVLMWVNLEGQNIRKNIKLKCEK
jgi:hypothetical protein